MSVAIFPLWSPHMYDEFESIVRALNERGAAIEHRVARRRADAAAARPARTARLRAEAKPEPAVPPLPDFGPPTEPLTVIPHPRYSAQHVPEIGWSR
ncbi:hypothetical protein [Microterricola viridarii]|uniref:Uncharacterized protein n=1 Tax=Microterricola viridarii TaxID=412690 RepID=A0A1H1Y9Y1_9MICO|nr:hypothetical protein [Microterricola viridarii]SDT18253.1 hypothetical protein SAMN04489834_3018 [Microterricola viridarii]